MKPAQFHSHRLLFWPISCLKMIAQNQMIFHRDVPENSISVRKESRIREPIFNVNSSSSFLSTYYGPVTVLPPVRQDNNLEYYFRCFFSDILSLLMPTLGFSSGSVVKNLSAYARDAILIPGLGRSPGKGNGNTLQYTEKPDHGVAKEMDITEWISNNNNKFTLLSTFIQGLMAEFLFAFFKEVWGRVILFRISTPTKQIKLDAPKRNMGERYWYI